MDNDRKEKKPSVRPVTENVFTSLILDVWPNAAGVQDFGIESDRHYGALQYAVKCHGVTREELDRALGDGEALTALLRRENPYHGVTFKTPWDGLWRNITTWADPGPGRFSPGRIHGTVEALHALSEDDIKEALRRHVAGDWGDGNRADNDLGLKDRGPLLSVYRGKSGQVFWVLTEANWEQTTVLLPEP